MVIQKLYVETPLIHSPYLSDIVDNPVYLKLENVQITHSFKFRGFLACCQAKLREKNYEGFCTFSAGNGGIAAATACHMLGKKCHIFLPKMASARLLKKMRSFGAETTIKENGAEAHTAAKDFERANSNSWYFIDPHGDEEVWDGYSNMVLEIKEQLPPEQPKPSCIVVSVGGGGFLIGILKGLEKAGWKDVPVVAMETIGTHAFSKSLAAGKPVFNEITSVAKSLGAPTVTAKIFDVIPNFNVISSTLSDKDAVKACLRFADDHTFLVEPAAGVSLATVYENVLPDILQDKGFDITSGPVIIIVCGGNDTNFCNLASYVRDFQLES